MVSGFYSCWTQIRISICPDLRWGGRLFSRFSEHPGPAADTDGEDLANEVNPNAEAEPSFNIIGGLKIRPGQGRSLLRQLPHVLQGQVGLSCCCDALSRVKLSAISASTWGTIPA